MESSLSPKLCPPNNHLVGLRRRIPIRRLQNTPARQHDLRRLHIRRILHPMVRHLGLCIESMATQTGHGRRHFLCSDQDSCYGTSFGRCLVHWHLGGEYG